MMWSFQILFVCHFINSNVNTICNKSFSKTPWVNFWNVDSIDHVLIALTTTVPYSDWLMKKKPRIFWKNTMKKNNSEESVPCFEAKKFLKKTEHKLNTECLSFQIELRNSEVLLEILKEGSFSRVAKHFTLSWFVVF